MPKAKSGHFTDSVLPAIFHEPVDGAFPYSSIFNHLNENSFLYNILTHNTTLATDDQASSTDSVDEPIGVAIDPVEYPITVHPGPLPISALYAQDDSVSLGLDYGNNYYPIAYDEATDTYIDPAPTPVYHPLIIDILANDKNLDVQGRIYASDLDAIEILSQPTHGTIVLNADGTVTYTATDAFYHGEDSFTYQIFGSDGEQSEVATVHITLDTQSAAYIVLGADVAQTTEDTPVIINLFANDTAQQDDMVFIAENNELGWTLNVTQPRHGAVVDLGNGKVQYTPDAHYTGDDRFTYTVTDAQGHTSNPNSVTVAVDGGIILPVEKLYAVDDSVNLGLDIFNNEGLGVYNPLIIDILANDYHLNLKGRLFESDLNSIEILTQPTHGTIVLNENGTVTYTANNNTYHGDDSFTYRLTGNAGEQSEVATVNIRLDDKAIEVLPLFLADDSATTTEGVGKIINLFSNDHPGEVFPQVWPEWTLHVTQPRHGTVEDLGYGKVLYTPDPNFIGQDTFSYTVTDRVGHTSNPASVTVDIDLPARLPEIVGFDPESTPYQSDLITVTSEEHPVQVTFESNSAAYHNSLGWYTVAADGTIGNVQLIWADAQTLSSRETVSLGTMQTGTQIGLFLAANQAAILGSLREGDTLSFHNNAGQVANFNTDSNIQLVITHADGSMDTVSNVYHMANGDLNLDGMEHSRSLDLSPTQTEIGFEDLAYHGDGDFNDLKIFVNTGNDSLPSDDDNLEDFPIIIDDGDLEDFPIIIDDGGLEHFPIIIDDIVNTILENEGASDNGSEPVLDTNTIFMLPNDFWNVMVLGEDGVIRCMSPEEANKLFNQTGDTDTGTDNPFTFDSLSDTISFADEGLQLANDFILFEDSAPGCILYTEEGLQQIMSALPTDVEGIFNDVTSLVTNLLGEHYNLTGTDFI